MHSLPSQRHYINSFQDYNQIFILNFFNQQSKNVSPYHNPKIGVKYKTPIIENPYSILMDESEEKIPEESHNNERGTLRDNPSNKNQSGNEQYLIPDTGTTTTCITLNTKLENKKKVNDGMRAQSCTGTITTSIATGDLLLKNLPQKARKENKMDGTSPLLSIGNVCSIVCMAVFKKKKWNTNSKQQWY